MFVLYLVLESSGTKCGAAYRSAGGHTFKNPKLTSSEKYVSSNSVCLLGYLQKLTFTGFSVSSKVISMGFSFAKPPVPGLTINTVLCFSMIFPASSCLRQMIHSARPLLSAS